MIRLLTVAVHVVRLGHLPTPTHMKWAREAEDYVLQVMALGYSQDEAVDLLHEAVQRGGHFPLALRLAALGYRPVGDGTR